MIHTLILFKKFDSTSSARIPPLAMVDVRSPCLITGGYILLLVGGLEHLLFVHILGIIIPTDQITILTFYWRSIVSCKVARLASHGCMTDPTGDSKRQVSLFHQQPWYRLLLIFLVLALEIVLTKILPSVALPRWTRILLVNLVITVPKTSMSVRMLIFGSLLHQEIPRGIMVLW